MTDEELTNLEGAALAALQKPVPYMADELGAAGLFHEAANPTAVLELISDLQRAQKERNWLAEKYADAFNMLGRPDRMTVTKALAIAKEATND